MQLETRIYLSIFALGAAAAGVAVVYGRIQAGAATHTATQAVETPAERAERNKKTLSGIALDTLPMWGEKELKRRRTLAAGRSEYKGEGCPAASAVEGLPTGDEFERKDRDAKLEAAKDACWKELATTTDPMPHLAVLSLPLNAAGEYDFSRKAFPFGLPKLRQGATVEEQLRIMLARPPGLLHVDVVDRNVLVADYSQIGAYILEGVDSRELTTDSLYLPIPEERARTLKERLVKNKGAVLEVIFEPGSYGPSGLVRNDAFGSAVKGVLGRAVGYRVMDADGPLQGLTPFVSQELAEPP